MDSSIMHPAALETDDFFDILAEIVSVGIEILATAVFNALEQLAHIKNVIQSIYSSNGKVSAEVGELSWVQAEQLGERNGLSSYKTLAGYLMHRARKVRGRRLSDSDYAQIALRLDEEHFRPVRCLEGRPRKSLAYNNRDARKAIHTFGQALESNKFRRATLRSLYRAHYQWKQILCLSVTAG